jgi:hypothetical protein
VPNYNLQPFRRLLLFSAFMGVVGNLIHAFGIRKASVHLAVVGRLLIGFGSADIVHLQFVAKFVPASLIISESARLVQYHFVGLATGLFVGSIAEFWPFNMAIFGVVTMQATSWLMVFLWLIQFIRVFFRFKQPVMPTRKLRQPPVGDSTGLDHFDAADSSDTSGSDPGPASIFHRSTSRTFSNPTSPDHVLASELPRSPVDSFRQGGNDTSSKKRRFRRVKTFVNRIRKILSFNVAVSLTLGMVCYTAYSQEILFSSCALITERYFQWKGSTAGLFLGSLSLLVLPTDFVCEQISRRYEERTVMKVRLDVFFYSHYHSVIRQPELTATP